MLRIPLLILILLPLSSVVPASATNTFEGLKQTDTGRVDQVIDALTVTLKSGKIIRLSSLDIPGFVYPEPSEHSLKAKEELEKLLPEGTEVILHQTIKPKVGRENRMGQMLAHLKTKKDDIWVQGHMIENGLARVAPTIRNFELSEDMYALEEKARAEKIGLWDEKAYPVLTHDNAMQAIGNFAVVEGVIQKAASVRNNVYLNFGDDWRKDFTIQIKPPVRKLLVREDIDPLALNGQKVRVRGWVREYNGALIELNHPASLEILKDTAQSSTVSKN